MNPDAAGLMTSIALWSATEDVYTERYRQMFYNQILRIKAFVLCLFCSYLRDIRKFMEEVEWQVLQFNNFSVNIKFLSWKEKLF